ncbi:MULTISPECIES: hypothetical protein [Haloarcula]|uniref:hypothetical protein n=1 Tax=Haloarcula TaxID=2237 RepID=UPI0023EBAAFB|nr:hypothetical protein [Halomicroarcula sp. XH51]
MSEVEAGEGENRMFRIVETGQRVSGLELELHLFFDRWRVSERSDDRRVVRTADGETLTLERDREYARLT